MSNVLINGAESPIKPESMRSIAEVIELIKSQIDPEHMITQITLNGNELNDADWHASTNQYETLIIEAQTDTPQEFVRSRFATAWEVCQSMYTLFRDSRKSFQSGDTNRANKILVEAVNTARAFFEWYGSLLALVPENERAKYDINASIEGIVDICKRLCQQQLYQSWWALGDTIEKELEPRLDKLEDQCRKFA